MESPGDDLDDGLLAVTPPVETSEQDFLAMDAWAAQQADAVLGDKKSSPFEAAEAPLQSVTFAGPHLFTAALALPDRLPSACINSTLPSFSSSFTWPSLRACCSHNLLANRSIHTPHVCVFVCLSAPQPKLVVSLL